MKPKKTSAHNSGKARTGIEGFDEITNGGLVAAPAFGNFAVSIPPCRGWRDYFRFRLYIAGGTTNSAQAVANLNALCRERLPDRHAIEIVDVLREPKRALTDGIFLTPTLVKLAPAPVRTIVGTLSQLQQVIDALGLGGMAA